MFKEFVGCWCVVLVYKCCVLILVFGLGFYEVLFCEIFWMYYVVSKVEEIGIFVVEFRFKFFGLI